MPAKKPASPFIRLNEAGKPVTPRAKTHAMVKDTTTGLTWSQDFIRVDSWAAAEAACKALRLGGHKDWRMPTIKELISIVDYGKRLPAIDTKAFAMPKDDSYPRFWSSSPVVGWPECARGASPSTTAASAAPAATTAASFVRCAWRAPVSNRLLAS